LALPGQEPPSLAAAAPTPAQWLASSIDEYRCGLALNPCDAELWFYAAVGLWQLARGRSVADAQLAFRHSLALNPSDARAANNLGVVALERAEAAKAEGAEANTKADGTPSEAAGAADEAAAAAAGSAAVATAALEEALAWFLDAAARDPLGVGADSALNAGVALLRLGRDTDALAHVRRAAQQHPHHERLKSALRILTEGSG
jgi:tetratricopeptide (TPR) repeat protein